MVLLPLDFLERLWHGAHRRSFQWLLLGISLAWVGQQMVTGRFAIEEANRYKDAWLRFVAGDWTPDMLRYVYPDRERAQAGLAYLSTNDEARRIAANVAHAAPQPAFSPLRVMFKVLLPDIIRILTDFSSKP
ncbi:MAG: hypothetical protein WB689_06895 [Xanthobacteraceae bacterium]